MTLDSSPLLRRLPVAAGAVLLGLLAASPSQAAERAQRLRSDRPGAERALQQAQALAQGRGAQRGRELTPALASVYGRAGALGSGDREAAEQLLARPTDNTPGQPGGPYTVPDAAAFSAHFCFHWVESTNDAPPGADGNPMTIPAYVQQVANVFEFVWAREHKWSGDGGLGWTEPISDDALGGCSNGGLGLTDVYLKDLGELGLYGYAAPDAGQGNTQRPYAFLVMDDDYTEYGYEDPMDPLKVTAAHEYNHVIQYAYDVLQDKWMFESTATWMEEKVFPDIDDYHQYVKPWAQLTTMPITRFNRQEGDKVYGSAVFNHWLDEVYGEDVVRRAWELSIQQDSFAPAAYDRAIRFGNGPGFSYELYDFAASTAEWQKPQARVHDGAAFDDVKRQLELPVDGSALSGKLDHTAYALFDVEKTNAPRLELTGKLPDGVAGGIALVGRKGETVWKTAGGELPQGGVATVKLDDPGQYERITAVIVNSDYDVTDWNGTDWVWANDQAPILLAAKAVTGGGGGNGGGQDDGGQDDGGQTGGSSTGGGFTGGGFTGGSTGGGGTPPPTALLRISATGLPRAAKATVLTLKAQSSVAGTFTAKATVDAATAKRLGLGRKATAIGTGKATLAKAGTAKLAIKLTAKAKARLKRARGSVKVAVRITFASAAGGTTSKTLTLKLKR